MLAKLFDDIGIASLIRSVVLSVILLLLVMYVSGPEQYVLQILSYKWLVPAPWTAALVIPLLAISVVWYNSAINAIPLFKGDYQVSILSAILLIPVLITQGSAQPDIAHTTCGITYNKATFAWGEPTYIIHAV